MKRFLFALLALCPGVLQAQSFGSYIHVGPTWMEPAANPGLTNAAGMVLDGATERVAFKYYPLDSTAITAVNCNLTIVGTPGIVVRVETNSSDAPSGSLVGTSAASAVFSPASTGFTGAQSLGADTGTLTLNTPVWIVYQDGESGNDPSASHSAQLRHAGQIYLGGQKLRHYNGTDWTTTSAVGLDPVCVVTHSSGTLAGFGHTASQAASAQTDIFGTNRQGLTMRFGSRTTFAGCKYRVTKSGTPSNLQCVVYEGATERASCTMTAADIVSGEVKTCVFASPFETAADADVTLGLRQASDGGDGSNDYDLRTLAVQSGLIASMLPTNWRMKAGTGDDPTSWSEVTTEAPMIEPVIFLPTTAFDEEASGGGRRGFFAQ